MPPGWRWFLQGPLDPPHRRLAACYVGHGAFGIITKAAWVPYFAVVGIPEWLAWRLMPVVGTIDIAARHPGAVRPMPVVLLYMAVWGVWTALLRPLPAKAGGSFWSGRAISASRSPSCT